jgi:hypothetical protein
MLETLLYKHINIKLSNQYICCLTFCRTQLLTYKIIQGIEQVSKTCQGSISGMTSASRKLPKAS